VSNPNPNMSSFADKPFRILSVDGGGFRGVYAAHILARIEQEYDVDLRNHFQLIAGTSTGSIIAAGLACGMRACEIVEFYEKHGPRIFPRWFIPRFGFFRSRYRNQYLHDILQELFADRRLGQVTTPLIIPATDIGNGCVHVFKSGYDEGFVRDRNVLIRDAVMASCSAPTYFDPQNVGEYLLADGGLWANSPSLVAVIDAKKRLGKDLDSLKVFSLGTGVGRSFYPQKRPWWKRYQGWGLATRWQHGKFISMLLNLQSETANNMTGLLLRPEQILRINFNSDFALPLDDPADLRDLKSHADRDFSHKAEMIKTFLDLNNRGM